MGKIDEQKITKQIILQFPKLKDDKYFSITSRPTPEYNCIAWALQYNNRWFQPFSGISQTQEGNFAIKHDRIFRWPPEAVGNKSQEELNHISSLVDAFKFYGYSICDTDTLEDDYQKVALYYQPSSNIWTHAARQRPTGVWTSKLGESHDIAHGTPYTIESSGYGKVYCIMKKPFSR